ncbi:MAG: hypothetical protein KGM47_12075 [Acidobacteriota bacterium]|nr:hypothetical protein [Acidobacteriota bacterium]
MDARIACIHCDAALPRPFALSDADEPPKPNLKIAYYMFVCGGGACTACRSLNGLRFLPEKLSEYRVPNPACEYPVCWCHIFGVCWDEGTRFTSDGRGNRIIYHSAGDAADVAAFLRRFGGVATAAQIDVYVDEQLAPQRERTAREDANVEMWRRAYAREKISPVESISLYRESIQAWKATLRADAASRWSYLDESYDRLTLMLERARQFAEALDEIDDFHAFCGEMGRMPSVETIAKRQARLKRKIRRAD